ncbi:FG-GAP repeat domain-containing protein [Dyadobacter sp.]|uniref:FG-GAP repeat domain-containing protein n=1 Tax=Dyadobacter sp. TaxID=1914288 RepID=UPI003F704280
MAWKAPDAHSVVFTQNQNTDSIAEGRQLAKNYCVRCHLFPESALLDKSTWINSVLPNMGQRLGLHFADNNPFADLLPAEEKLIRQLNIYPETALISPSDWEKIVAYYRHEAPAEPLPQLASLPISDSLPLFRGQYLTVSDNAIPKTTLLKFDPRSSQLYVGDDQQALFVLDSTLHLKEKYWIDSAPTDIDFPLNAPPRLLTIGVFAPSERREGRLMSVSKAPVPPQSLVNIQSLPRPVQFTSGDLNMDGKADALICGFGNHSGKLFWLDNFDPAKEHILKELPGARHAQILDFNKDKKPDVIALMAQAREEISIFYNLGNGKFREKVLLQFPPSYGMSYFELVDFNKDGFQDILLTNGDNWDLSNVPKNYHGVRIYLNDGKDNFKLSWFYPLYGASKAIARDFDNDGDIDIGATSFYNDLENPAHGFVYLSNEGKMNFKASSTPLAGAGKWLTMEAGDFDKDGDIDIVLGSYFHTIGEVSKLMARGTVSFPQLLVLTNRKKDK